MRRREARTGVRVRVRDGARHPSFEGMSGTVMRTYRSSDRTALHVRLDDGRWQLLWPHELEDLGREEPGMGRGP